MEHVIDDRPRSNHHALRHLRVGWCGLALFVAMGLALESLHAFKAGFYLDPEFETRRLLWTLAHSHGALLGLVNLALVPVLHRLPAWSGRPRQLASIGLIGATVLMPVGFFLGGLDPHGGDPGRGVLLVPLGGGLLLLSLCVVSVALLRSSATDDDH